MENSQAREKIRCIAIDITNKLRLKKFIKRATETLRLLWKVYRKIESISKSAIISFQKELRPTVFEKLVVLDDTFPQAQPLGFRNAEINEYFQKLPLFKSFTIYPMLPGKNAWFQHGYGTDEKTFKKNKKLYAKFYPQYAERVKYLFPSRKYQFGLAYSFFLGTTHTLLPFFEKNSIDFVFTLYPGGGFGLNHPGSDQMLREILSSQCFKRVFVTQKITLNYLLDKKFCDPEKIEFIWGGVISIDFEKSPPKLFYGKTKSTFDICFVAAKYSEHGRDKGYDLFIKVAHLLKEKIDIRFHVVGNFDENDIDVRDIKNNLVFYGFQPPSFFLPFYSQMDIFLAPNRSSQLFPGNFDGFPLGIDAASTGVTLFVADDLNQNICLKNGEDFILINHDPQDIADQIIQHYKNVSLLYRIGENGREIVRQTCSAKNQTEKRIKTFQSILSKKCLFID
ncbi:MAG: glycosyltransferase family 4 protein [Bdellovibrionaceae bacterium]|nr:glycosyltransferase family 4 protein [Pseudobdellovibrionaceae bacterium]